MWPFDRHDRRALTRISPPQSWSPPFRTIAVIHGGADWWHDTEIEELNPDFPSPCPLFHNVCARMPERWTLSFLTHDGDLHNADFTDRSGASYTLCFTGFEDGLLFQLSSTRDAAADGVHDFLQDLKIVLDETDGMECVVWHAESMFDSGCLRYQYERYGMPSPFDPIEEDG